jgi:hypothetical protein
MVENLGTHDSGSMQTNAEGDYVFTLLPIGSYTIRIEANGFRTFSVPGLTLASADHARVDAQMVIGQMAESVEVIAQARSALIRMPPTTEISALELAVALPRC